MEEYVWVSKLVHHPGYVYHAHTTLNRLARQYGVKITTAGPDDTNLSGYVKVVEEAVLRRVSGIMIVGWGDDEIVPAVDSAIDAGIPVITVDSDIPGSKRLAHTGTDWYDMGGRMAEELAACLDDQGKILLMGMLSLPSVMAGFHGFHDRIAHHPEIEVLGPVNVLDTGFSRAAEIVADYLSIYPDLAGIAAFDGNSGPGAALALEKAGKGLDIKLACVDLEPPQLELLRRGLIDVAFIQKREAFTYRAFQMLYTYQHGSPTMGNLPGPINIPGNIDTGYVIVTKENADTYEAELSLDQVFESHELSQRLALVTSMVENSPEAALATDVNGRIVYANPSTVRKLGFDERKLLQINFENIFQIDAKQRAEIAMSIAEGGSYRLETLALRNDSSSFPVLLSISPLKTDVIVRGMVIIASDISEREIARHALQKKTLQQAKLIETARHLTESLDVNEVFLRIGRGAKEILEANDCYLFLLEADGKTLTPVVSLGEYGQQIMMVSLDIDSSFTGQAVKARHSLIFNDAGYDDTGYQIPGTPENEEEHILTAPLIQDGEVLGALCLSRKAPRFIQEDSSIAETFAAYAATALKNSQVHNRLRNEVRERKRAEEELKVSEEKYRNMVELAPDGILTVSLNGTITSCNSTFLILTGCSREEVVGKHYTSLPSIIPHDFDRLEKIFGDIIDGNHNPPSFEFEWVNKSGEKRQGDILISQFRKNGDVNGYLVIVHDLTEKKQAQFELQESQVRYRTISELTSDFAYSYQVDADLSLTLEWVTGALSRITGYSTEELLQTGGWDDLVYPDDIPLVHKRIKTLLAGKETTVEYRVITRDQGIRWVLDYAKPVYSNGYNRVNYIYGAVQDITQRKQHEREQEAIVNVTTALRSAHTRAEMPPIILDQVVAMVEAEGAELATRDPVTGESLIEFAVGKASIAVGSRIPSGKGIVGRVIETGQPYISDDTAHDPQVVTYDTVLTPLVLAAIPLITEDKTVGALVVGRGARFDEADIQLLSAIGNIAANAMQRATLYEETQRRLQRLVSLHNVDKAMTANVDLYATLNVILEQVESQLGIDAADILVYEAPTQELVYSVGRGFRAKATLPRSYRVGKGYAGRVVMERRMIRIANLQATRQFRENLPPAFAEEGFVVYIGLPLIAKGDLKGVLELYHRSPMDPDQEWISFLDTLARQAAIAIDNASLFDGLQRTNLELMLSYDTTLEGWAKALEVRSHETEGHSRRVTELTMRLARIMGMSKENLVHVRRGALLHDIGKMGIPDHILHKPGPLNDDEWEIMRQHPVISFDLLSTIPFLHQAVDIPYCHHEKWDGSGYPRGLKGEQIPLSARVFAVVDVWDALHNDRSYRKAWEEERIHSYIQEQSGLHFDPQVVEAFFQLLQEEFPQMQEAEPIPIFIRP